MADMELVIKIPTAIYEASQILDVKHEDTIQIPLEVIANGTPLQKGHGRLIDADVITKDLNTFRDAFSIYQQTGDKSLVRIVCIAETILEADTEG